MPKKTNKSPVDIQEGKQIFNAYYKKKHKKKPPSVKQAKLFDAMYQKKPKKTLMPNSKKSYKYRMKKGVETFDMSYVDSFPEGEAFIINNKTVYSKGKPRLKKNNKLYSEEFSEQYKQKEREGRRINKKNKQVNSPRSNKKLIELYWDKFNKRQPIENILKTFKLSTSELDKLTAILLHHNITHDNDLYNIHKNILLQLGIEEKTANLLHTESKKVQQKIQQNELVESRKNKQFSSELELLIRKYNGETVTDEEMRNAKQEDINNTNKKRVKKKK